VGGTGVCCVEEEEEVDEGEGGEEAGEEEEWRMVRWPHAAHAALKAK
jgi:hypothetical protein